MPCVSAPNGTTDSSLAARMALGSVPLERSTPITIEPHKHHRPPTCSSPALYPVTKHVFRT
eukprot:1914934-Prymnesium_polylepis.1